VDLECNDVFIVNRFNSPPLRKQDDTLTWAKKVDHNSMIFGPERIVPGEMSGADRLPWIYRSVAPKCMARAEVVDRVGCGGHSIVARASLRVRRPEDLAIVHLPLTTPDRFRRKVAVVQNYMSTYGHRFAHNQWAHWREWLLLTSSGLIDAEFERQVISFSDIGSYLSRRILTTPKILFTKSN
jgi:hypothetical protein